MVDSVVPAARQQKGFSGAFVLTITEKEMAQIITLWATQEDLANGEASGYYREQVAKGMSLFAAAPVREVHEVQHAELLFTRPT